MNRYLSILLGCSVWACSLRSPQEARTVSILAIRNVTVIDTLSGRAIPNSTVIVRGDRIASVDSDDHTNVPPGARTIDGSDKFLIPGLWDMHVHVFTHGAPNGVQEMETTAYFRLMIANGVTGFRDMGGSETPQQITELRKRSGDGSALIPKFIAAGPIADGPKPIWPHSLPIGSAADARSGVAKIRAEGYDFFKVYNFVPRDAYFAVAAEAAKQRFPYVGHVPRSVTPLEASNAGQKSIEHLDNILMGCSSREDEIHAMWLDTLAKGQPALPTALKAAAMLLPSYDPAKAAALFQAFARNETWQVPTFTVLRSFAYSDDSAFTQDERRVYIPRAVIKAWDPHTDFRLRGRKPEDWQTQKRMYAKLLEVARDMHQQGVHFLAGTDVHNPYIFAGFSLHDELGNLVDVGLTNLESLQASTSSAARFMGKEQDFGTVEAGKVADLVLLDANPLEQIGNTRAIRAVILSGTYFGRQDIDALLAQARAEARNAEPGFAP